MLKFNPKLFYEDENKIPAGLNGLYEKSTDKDKNVIFVLKKDVQSALSGDSLKAQIKKLKETIKDNLAKKQDPKEEDPEEDPEEIEEPEENPTKKSQNKQLNNREYLKQLNKNKSLEKQILNIKKELDKKGVEEKGLLDRLIQNEKKSLIVDAIKEAGGSVPLLKDFVFSSVGHETEDGNNKFYIKDKDGSQRFIGSEEMSIKDFVQELKEQKDYSQAFGKSSGVGTSDFSESKDNKISINKTSDFDKLSNDQKAGYINTHGSKAFLEAGERFTAEKVNEIEKNNKLNSNIPHGVI